MDENRTISWCVHMRGLQRGWTLIENGTRLGRLATLAAPDRCMLGAGVPEHVRGSGDPARSIAFREK